MKIQTNVKAGGQKTNCNEKQVKSKGLTVKTNVAAGNIKTCCWFPNHNEKMI